MGREEKDADISIAASAMGRKRWAGLSEEQRSVAMEKARAERQRKLSKARRREIASVAAKARWAKARAEHPESGDKAKAAKPKANAGARGKAV